IAANSDPGTLSVLGLNAIRNSWMSKEVALNTLILVTAIGSAATTPVRRKTKTSNAMKSATRTRSTAQNTPKSFSASSRNAIPTGMTLNVTARNTIVRWPTATIEHTSY
uniref:Uncharacterized protein n=1 Tax=Fusarium oxysporum (strain Fo5176) TaxID=660025 RepID=A0A0D2XEL5_FUSOF